MSEDASGAPVTAPATEDEQGTTAATEPTDVETVETPGQGDHVEDTPDHEFAGDNSTPVEVHLHIVQGRALSDAEVTPLTATLALVTRLLNEKLRDLGVVFHSHTSTPLLPGTRYPEKRNRGYPDEWYFTALENCRGTSGLPKNRDQHIGICAEYLDESSFNRQDWDRGVGIVTTVDWEDRVPLGVTLEGYLVFLILCTYLCLRYEYREHDRRQFCLFDMCEEPADLKRCLSAPEIKDCCLPNLTGGARQLSDEDMTAYQSLLHDAGRRDIYEFMSGAFGSSANAFLGGISAAFVANIVSNEWPKYGVLLAVIAIIVGVSLWAARRGRQSLRVQAHRRVVFWLGTAVVFALCLMAAALIFRYDIPHIQEGPGRAPAETQTTTTTSAHP